MKKKLLSLTLAVSVALLFCSCSANKEAQNTFYSMNTVMRITAFSDNQETGNAAIRAAQQRVTELDRLWSVTNAESELSRINSGELSTASYDTYELLSFGLEIADKTEGAFEPTIYPVLTAWGFTLDENRVPSEAELAELLKRVDYRYIRQSGSEVTLQNGATLDFGAIAKGYAGDCVTQILRERGISSALIDLGGSITAVGKKPDGSDWKIGVKDPTGDGNVGILALSDLSAVTSGAYERYFTAEDGTVYGHIIDPATGCPVDNDLLSVTIISENATLCDALSTALFVMGSEKARNFCRENGSVMGFDIILITKNRELILSGGAAERFTLTDNTDSLVTL